MSRVYVVVLSECIICFGEGLCTPYSMYCILCAGGVLYWHNVGTPNTDSNVLDRLWVQGAADRALVR